MMASLDPLAVAPLPLAPPVGRWGRVYARLQAWRWGRHPRDPQALASSLEWTWRAEHYDYLRRGCPVDPQAGQQWLRSSVMDALLTSITGAHQGGRWPSRLNDAFQKVIQDAVHMGADLNECWDAQQSIPHRNALARTIEYLDINAKVSQSTSGNFQASLEFLKESVRWLVRHGATLNGSSLERRDVAICWAYGLCSEAQALMQAMPEGFAPWDAEETNQFIVLAGRHGLSTAEVSRWSGTEDAWRECLAQGLLEPHRPEVLQILWAQVQTPADVSFLERVGLPAAEARWLDGTTLAHRAFAKGWSWQDTPVLRTLAKDHAHLLTQSSHLGVPPVFAAWSAAAALGSTQNLQWAQQQPWWSAAIASITEQGDDFLSYGADQAVAGTRELPVALDLVAPYIPNALWWAPSSQAAARFAARGPEAAAAFGRHHERIVAQRNQTALEAAVAPAPTMAPRRPRM